MTGLQDLAVRLAELLDIPEDQARVLSLRVVPVMTIESIVGQPTTRVSGLVGAPCIGGVFQGPEALEIAKAQIFNPVDSGVIVHVDAVIGGTDTTGGMNIRTLDTPLTSLGTRKTYADRRRSGQPVAEMRFESSVGSLGTSVADWQIEAAVSRRVDLDSVILGEGQGLLVNPSSVNRSVELFWFWREVF